MTHIYIYTQSGSHQHQFFCCIVTFYLSFFLFCLVFVCQRKWTICSCISVSIRPAFFPFHFSLIKIALKGQSKWKEQALIWVSWWLVINIQHQLELKFQKINYYDSLFHTFKSQLKCLFFIHTWCIILVNLTLSFDNRSSKK